MLQFNAATPRAVPMTVNEAVVIGGGSDCHITYVESLDKANMKNLRDLESGTYILHGYFHPYAGSKGTVTFSTGCPVVIIRKDAGTHLQCVYPINNCIQFAAIMVDDSTADGYTFERKNIYLNNLIPAPSDAKQGQYIRVAYLEPDGTPVFDAAAVSDVELTSPNGTRYKLTVADDGALSAAAVSD